MKYTLEVVTLAVTDVDRAVQFYTEQLGFNLDVDYHPREGFRVVSSLRLGPAARSSSATD